jgi:hypothetical protein
VARSFDTAFAQALLAVDIAEWRLESSESLAFADVQGIAPVPFDEIPSSAEDGETLSETSLFKSGIAQ